MKKLKSMWADRALRLARDRGIARARDFREAGVPLVYLKRLTDQGKLIQLSRGLYQLPDLAGTESEHNLAEAARAVPNGIICLMSALRHHGLTTQLPQNVWLALPNKARAPKSPSIPLTIVRLTEPSLSAGIEHALIEGVTVPIYGPAKTVADCFKFRRRIGLDVATEALHDLLHQRKATPSELMAFAKIDRVESVVRPFLETLA